jgi:hypothetical protein
VSHVDGLTRFARHEAAWSRLAQLYLPLRTKGSPWLYGAQPTTGLPAQGWKLHLSATILSASRLLRHVGPALVGAEAVYKGAPDLRFLDRLNSGLDGYSQVGKCLTVYCRDEGQARDLAQRLHQLTVGIPHPEVPFDRPYRPGSCVFYRYGAFDDATLEAAPGVAVGAIRGPDGALVPDRRDAAGAVPAWMSDPFASSAGSAPRAPWSPLAVDFRAFQALRQRGRGGVYRALDLTRAPAGLCVIKEGLRHGETDPSGRDGRWRVGNEARALRALARAGIPVPGVLASFEVEGGRYLVLEHVDGRNLRDLLSGRRRLSPARASALRRELAGLVGSIHRAGWAWRDLKPENIMVAPGGGLRPLDFEGAWRVGTAPLEAWGTPAYRPPLAGGRLRFDPLAEDLYALQVVQSEIASRTRV